VIIGVNRYADTQISTLSGAANDARSIADALVRYAGFPRDQVILLASDQPVERQPTRGNILRRLSNLAGTLPRDGLLVVAFAGHGIERGGQAFLLPSDAQVSDDVYLLEQTALNVTQMKEHIRRTGVGQVLIILDACRNNVTGRGDSFNPLTETYRRGFNFDLRNREVTAFATLYATGVGQQAYEYKEKRQGYFTWALVEGLKGAAANEKGEVTLAKLVRHVEEVVPKKVLLDLGTGNEQKPFAQIEGYKANELIIAVAERNPSGATSGSPGAAVDPLAVELTFWETIKNSRNSDDYRAYLEKYPRGTFADLARIRLRTLSARKSSISSPVLTTYQFVVPTVDVYGKLLQRSKQQARYFTEELGGGVALEMVEIPGGAFAMGGARTKAAMSGKALAEYPQHLVKVSKFYMGKFEVTQAQWRAVARLPKVKRDLNPEPSYFKGDNRPVDRVLWDDAMEFCMRLSKKTGRIYRLPSEAEWEYACRAGTKTAYHFGEAITYELANYGSMTERMQRGETTAVGSLGVANAFGLFDMHGNVWEWCMDPWHENYVGAPSEASAWYTGGDLSGRVLRGSSWAHNAQSCRSSNRNFKSGEDQDSRGYYGFRVVMGNLRRS
jgi:formylglycine-generating enzyme required for sulfatase activity